MAVHSCMLSSLVSAIMTFTANNMEDDDLQEWAEGHSILILFPQMKCGFGILCYILAVMLMSWRDLENNAGIKYYAFACGAMSNIVIFFYIFHSFYITRKYNAKHKAE